MKPVLRKHSSKFKCLGVLIGAIFLSGCFQTETLIRVKPDGSGVIEETFLLPKAMLDSVWKLAKEVIPEGSKPKKEGMAEPQDPIEGMVQDARGKAEQYGPKVKFLSAVPVRTDTMGGYKALYAFEDINTLKINQNPENKVEKPGEKKEASSKTEENILFRLVKGPTSTLYVTMPEYKAEKKDQPLQEMNSSKKQTDPQTLEMMKEVFKDLSVKVSLEIEGTIVKTNATHRQKSLLTLMEMHFGKILENKDVFEKVGAAEPKTLEEMKELVKGLEGLKIEMNNPLVVEFK